MQRPPAITFRGVRASEALEADVRKRIDKLETYYQPITGCRVLVELAQRHHRAGNRYHVRIDLRVPGGNIVVAHEANLFGHARANDLMRSTKQDEPDPGRKHVRLAVHDAFDVAERRLKDFSRRQRGDVKTRRRAERGARS